MNIDFKLWNAVKAHFETALITTIAQLNEGRREPDKLRNRSLSDQLGLFQDKITKSIDFNPSGGQVACVMPRSSFYKEISSIKAYAAQGADEFAQVLLFSPLSANVNFAKHWDNFPVLMTILRTFYPHTVTPEQLKETVDAFGDKYYALAATVSGWKYDTIATVWNNRHALFQKLNKLNKTGDEIDLLAELVKIPGVAPVKAGFIAQLLFGKSGCLDTHNIDIYSKIFPDLASDLDPKNWGKDNSTEDQSKNLEAVKRYAGTLKKLTQRGVDTAVLWDVWVDFVGRMYKEISSGGRGLYADLEPALNPNDPKYQHLKTVVNKMKLGTSSNDPNQIVGIPTITGGPEGGGAGATHTIAAKDPLTIMNQFRKPQGSAEDWARAVPKHLNQHGIPIEKGIGDKPALMHYFGSALDDKGLDQDKLLHIFRSRLNRGGRKAWAARDNVAQHKLF